MINAYEEMRKTERLSAQVMERFGEESKEYAEIIFVEDYWNDEWQRCGGKVYAPPADILIQRIGAAKRAVAKHKRETDKMGDG